MITRRSLLTQALLMLAGCTFAKTTNPNKLGKLVVGVVAYGEGSGSIDRYQRFTQYLEKSLKTIIELEPAYNEVKSVEQIERRIWSLVFASPGLARSPFPSPIICHSFHCKV